MTLDPRAYLIDRFRGDATTLRARAAAQRQGAAAAARTNAPRHGPDAAASERMALACEDLVARLERLPDDLAGQLDGLDALGPALRALADRAPDPFVRSVYGGAATRVADIVARERALAAVDDDADVHPDDADDPAEQDDVDDDDLNEVLGNLMENPHAWL
ncbi:MAG TPA: hypothetical protein PKE51_11810, partial [Gemmatimonadaceae bacterium]|nr:hypothetical protein [Gemmatimonadaceae bacterium]